MTKHTFVLKLTDRPGGMELVAATFAHRGISLSTLLGNDGALDPEGRATVVVTFTATPARKEALRRTLCRLSRVVSVREYVAEAPVLRKTAVARLAEGAAALEGAGVTAERIAGDTYLLVGPPEAVDALLTQARGDERLKDVTHTVIAL